MATPVQDATPMDPRDEITSSIDTHGHSSTKQEQKANASPYKRKPSNASQTSPKRQRRTRSVSVASPRLTPELWQYIFTFIPPRQLARIQRVCKQFQLCLNVEPTASESTKGHARPLHPDALWAAARLLHHPTWPQPLSPMPDLQFWTLVLGRTCQFCKRLPESITDPDDPWASGPGLDGVRIVWQFGIRTCGSCLRERVQTEVSLLLTEQSTFLQVLPFTFITSTFHVISPSIIQSGTPIPPRVNLLKYFYKDHVNMAQTLLDQARKQSATTAYVDELLQIKKSRMESAADWEAIDPVRHLRSAPTSPNSMATSLSKAILTAASPLAPQALVGQLLGHASPGGDSHSLHRHQNSSSRNNRSMIDAIEAKAARRTDIELRCSALDPPIPTSLLPHMESFQAAIQISSPLTDDAWDLLRPRLEAQRDAAEQRVNERTANAPESHGLGKESNPTKGTKEETDRQLDESQELVRQLLGRYADEYIRDFWANGQAVTVELMPRFAADLLISVRARYYSKLSKDSANAHPSATSLMLSSMRWTYDNKVRPLTEARKELFMCNGCESLKLYAFDGVIQHYAARHTEAFSSGHIVVHWQTAEWPEKPPFAPDPDAKRRHAQDSLLQNHAFSGSMNAPQSGQLAPYTGGISPAPFDGPPYGHQRHPSGPFQTPPPFMAIERASHNFSPTYPILRGGFQAVSGHMGVPSASPIGGRSTYFSPGISTPIPNSAAWGPPAYPHPATYHQAPLPGAPPPPNLYQTQLEEVAGVARETWGLVSNVRALPPSVRVFCVITSVVSRFQQRFSNEPSLDLFTDCLINHKLMQPLKNASPLACKICVEKNESHEGSDSPSFPLSSGERKLYPFHSLLVHFKNVHIEHVMRGQDERRLDWKTDMIELPSDEYISRLSRAQGIDRAKMQLLVAAFPNTSWATEDDPLGQDAIIGNLSASNSPAGSGFPGPGRSSAASHHTRASGVQSGASGAVRLPPSSLTSVAARSPVIAEGRDFAVGKESASRQVVSFARGPDLTGLLTRGILKHTDTQVLGSPLGDVRPTASSGHLSRAGSRVQSSRGAAESKEDSADHLLKNANGDVTHDAKQDAPSRDGSSARNQSPESRHSQPTEATLTSLRELGYVVIPPGAPEHYERMQSMPVRRQRQERRMHAPSSRYQHHPYSRPGVRDRGYVRGYYHDDRQYFPPPRYTYPQYADYADGYDGRAPALHQQYGGHPSEYEMGHDEGYEIQYMRRRDIPQYYVPGPTVGYEEERDQAMRYASERYSRPPVEYESDAETSHEHVKTNERDLLGSRAGSLAK